MATNFEYLAQAGYVPRRQSKMTTGEMIASGCFFIAENLQRDSAANSVKREKRRRTTKHDGHTSS